MKKVFLWMTAIALLAGCAKEKDTNNVANTVGKTYTITASIDNPETRTTAERFQDTNTGKYKYSFNWEEDEQIAVVPTGYNTELWFDLVDATNGTFIYTPEDENEPEYTGFDMAVTPADALLSLEPSVDDYDIYFSGSYLYGHSNAIMVAGTPTAGPEGTQKFQFKHIAALVKVTYKNVPAGTLAMVFEADHNIKGVFNFNTATDVVASNDSFTDVEEDAPMEAMVMFEDVLEAPLASAEFFLPIPVGEYQTFQVRLVRLVDEQMETIPGSEQSWTASSPFTLVCADVVACPEVEVVAPVSVVENFSSSNASDNTYGCSSNLNTDSNRRDFDFTWSLDGSGTVFNNGIKLGKSGGNGSVTSTDILADFPAGSPFTVKVYAAVWTTDGGELIVSYGGNSIQKAAANDPITDTSVEYSADDFTTPTEFVFTKTADADALTIASSVKRILIDKVEIVGGGTPAPLQTLTVTPASDNPELVPAEGATLSYTVSTANIDAWDAVSNNTDFVVVKTSNGFNVVVAANETSSPKTATITVSGGSKSVEVTINQEAGDGPETPEAQSFIIKQSSIPFSGSGYQSYADITINGYKFEFVGIMKSGTNIQMNKNVGAIFNTSALGQRIVSISFTTITNSVTVSAGVDEDNLSTVTGVDGTYTFASGVKYFKISTGSQYAVIGEITITYIPDGGGDQPENPTKTVTFTPGTDTGATSVTKDGITVTMTTMNNSDYYQIYANESMKVESTDRTIKGISFSCTASGTNKYGPGNVYASSGTYSYNNNTGTWVGSTREVSLSSTVQVRMTSLTVTYVED